MVNSTLNMLLQEELPKTAIFIYNLAPSEIMGILAVIGFIAVLGTALTLFSSLLKGLVYLIMTIIVIVEELKNKVKKNE